jgi:hypothetical protein
MATAAPPRPALEARVRLADGREYRGPLEPRRHSALQLGLLHEGSDGHLEIAAGPRAADGRLALRTRRRADHYPRGGAGSDDGGWLRRALALAERHAAAGEEVFVGAAERARPEPGKGAVEHSRWLWVDVDKPGELARLWAFIAERPCQLVVETAGFGGVHAYWRLAESLPALTVEAGSGEVCEWVERANARLAAELHADPQCSNRDRVLRLAGTVNHKSGRTARILWADFHSSGRTAASLVGDLPDPRPPFRRRRASVVDFDDDLRRVPPPVYYRRLTGMAVGQDGSARCPSAAHEDRHPSARVWREPERGWYCFSCGAGGGVYDLASVVDGGPYGPELRGEDFRSAKQRAREALR